MKGAELPDRRQILQSDCLTEMGLDILQTPAPHMRSEPAADRAGTHPSITRIDEEIVDRLCHRFFSLQMTARHHRLRHLPKRAR